MENKVIDTINTITKNFGAFGTYLIRNELMIFGDLPEIPSGYTLINVHNDNDVQNVKKVMMQMNREIDMLYPDNNEACYLVKSDYEDRCFLTMLLFTNIFDYWFGYNTDYSFRDNNADDYTFDLLQMKVWDWVKGKIKTKALKNTAKEFYKAVTA